MNGGILAALVVCTACSAARAQDRPRLDFAPAAGLGCRDERWFRQQIVGSYGDDVFAPGDATSGPVMRVAVERRGATLVATAVETAADRPPRTVQPVERDASVGCDIVLARLASSLRLALGRAAARPSTATTGPRAEAPAPVAAPPTTVRAPPGPAEAEPVGWRPMVGLAGGVQWGALPTLGPVVALDLVLGRGRFELQFVGRYDLPAASPLDGGGSIVAQRWSLGAGACFRASTYFAACAAAEGAVVHARAEGFAQSAPVVGPQLAAGLRARGEVPIGPRLRVRLQIDGTASPVGVRVVSSAPGAESSPTPFWTTPVFQLAATLGFAWRGGVM